MDKRQLTDMITEVLNSSTLSNAVVSFEDDTHIKVQVISNEFEGKSFTNRFKFIDSLIKDKLPEIHENFFFKFEAFTKEESSRIPKEQKSDPVKSASYKESAKEL